MVAAIRFGTRNYAHHHGRSAPACFERCAPCWDDKKRYRRCDPSPPLTLVTAACAAYRFGRSRCPGPAQNGVWSCAGGKSHVTHHRRSAKLEKRNRTHTGRARCRADGATAMFCSGFSSSRLFRSVTLSCSSSRKRNHSTVNSVFRFPVPWNGLLETKWKTHT